MSVSELWGAMYPADTVIKVAVKDMAKQDESALRRDADAALPSSLASAGKGLTVGGALGGLAEGGAAAALGGGARATLRAALSGALQGGAIGGTLGGLLGVIKRSRTADARSAAQLELLHRDGQDKVAYRLDPSKDGELRDLDSQHYTPEVRRQLVDARLRADAERPVPSRAKSVGMGALLGGVPGAALGAVLGRRLDRGLGGAGAVVGGGLAALGGALLGNSAHNAKVEQVRDAQNALKNNEQDIILQHLLARIERGKYEEGQQKAERAAAEQRAHEQSLMALKGAAAVGAASAIGGGLQHFGRGKEQPPAHAGRYS